MRNMTLRTPNLVFLPLTYLYAASSGLAPRDVSGLVPDSSVAEVVLPDGGTIELTGFARVIFAAGSFETPETVTVKVTNTPSTPKWLGWYGFITEDRTPYLPFDVRITAERQPAAGYTVEIILPPSYLDAIRDSWPPRVYREFSGGGPMEDLTMYEELSSELNLEAGVIRARVVTTDVDRGTKLYDTLVVGCCEPNL